MTPFHSTNMLGTMEQIKSRVRNEADNIPASTQLASWPGRQINISRLKIVPDIMIIIKINK
jgi:hypothetical protein